MSALVAEHVTQRIDGHVVLADVNLELGVPGITALCGPNGAGKTTLLTLLAGLKAPTEGRITLRGRPVAQLSEGLRARCIAIVPQFLDSGFDLTVEEFVALGRLHRQSLRDRLLLTPLGGESQVAVERALSTLNLTQLAKRTLWSLSGGERARAAIAAALSQDAPYLLLDEPTAHLDPAFTRETLEILTQLAVGGLCVLVILHDLTLASLYADRIMLMKDGRLVADGNAVDVLTIDRLQDVFLTPLTIVQHPTKQRPVVLPG